MPGQNHRNPRNKHSYLHESAATNLDWALEPNDRWISADRRVPINLIQHAWPIRGYATMSVVSWLDIGRFTCNWTRNNRWESWHARRANTAVSLCSIVRTCLWRTSKGIKTMRSTVDREPVPGRRRLQFDSNCRLVPNNSDNYALLISPRLFCSNWPNVFPRNTWNNSWIVDRLIGEGDYQPRRSSWLN